MIKLEQDELRRSINLMSEQMRRVLGGGRVGIDIQTSPMLTSQDRVSGTPENRRVGTAVSTPRSDDFDGLSNLSSWSGGSERAGPSHKRPRPEEEQ
ncbi:hypothetical protein BGX31_005081, partial [Mortierella sp. GBA43]